MSDDFQEFFTLEVRHAYFDGEPCPAVTFRRVEPPPARLAKLGLVLRPAVGAMAVFRLIGGLDDLPAMDLVFEVVSADPSFFAYTDTGAELPDTTLWFDTAQATLGDDGRVASLQRGAKVSAADRIARDALPTLGSATRRPSSSTVGFVRVRFQAGKPPAKTYCMTFDARSTIWEYCVVGFPDSPIAIRDLDGKIEFEEAGPMSLPDGRSARVFRSKLAIPLRQRSSQRFQLVESTRQVEHVVIKRLPSASLSALAFENVDGDVVGISTVWVYR